MSVLKEAMIFSQPDGEESGFTVLSLFFFIERDPIGRAAPLGLSTTTAGQQLHAGQSQEPLLKWFKEFVKNEGTALSSDHF